MFCPNCGTNVTNGAGFCPTCGSRMAATTPAYTTQPVGPTGGFVQQGFGNKSSWDGGVFDTFLNSLAASLIMSLTCGIATPWAICYMMKYIVSHAIVDGKRLRFDGTGGSLFGNWIKWFFLTIITCGIYSFWVTPRLYQWVVSHIHHVD